MGDGTDRIAAARSLWEPVGPFLDTASFGLPPRPAFDALQAALEDWRRGRSSFESWIESTNGSRSAFARMVGVDADQVAVGATVSELVGLIAAALPDGAHVVVPDIEFTSMLFPWLIHADRGVRITLTPPAVLASVVETERPDVVAFSTVQSATGEVADIDAVLTAAAGCGALTVVDATQSCGWLPLDASRFDAVVCAAYKWLMSPRGTAFLTISDELLARVKPLSAGWFAGEDVATSFYGPPLRLARSARRLDTSPAWFSWVGTQPALELIESVGVPAIHHHDVALANRFRAGLDMVPSDSAIVSVQVAGAAEKLEAAGVRAAVRGGHLRAAFHLYNTVDDVDAALAALAG